MSETTLDRWIEGARATLAEVGSSAKPYWRGYVTGLEDFQRAEEETKPDWYCCEKHKQACLQLRWIGDDPHGDAPDA